MDLARETAPGLARETAPGLAMARAPDLAMNRAPPVPATSSLVAPAPAPWQPSPAYSVQYQTGEVTSSSTARPGHSVQPSYRYGYSTPDKVSTILPSV